MLEQICKSFLLFLSYSFLGWCVEVLYQYVQKKRFVNRGFLIGPLCTIYGYGALAIIFTLSKYKTNFFVLFGMSILICSILEYVTSYYMEKIFKTRWWDYSDKKYNINGRICAETMIPFGLLGCLVIYIINPIVEIWINLIPLKYLNLLSIILFLIFIVDNIISSSLIISFRSQITNIEKDATEEITRRVREAFAKKDILHRRLINAFPSMINAKERLQELNRKINNEIKKLDIRRRKEDSKDE